MTFQVVPRGWCLCVSGFSAFPGNINVLCFDLDVYAKVLQRTAGAVPEFVNPKYKNPEKTEFTPTRLECMMQDFPKLLGTCGSLCFMNVQVVVLSIYVVCIW